MTRAWNGRATWLFIPLDVQGAAAYVPAAANYREQVQRRVYVDPDPTTNDDRSLMSYFAAVSYNRAIVDATVSRPVVITNPAAGMNLTSAAINAQPDAHKYEYLAVVYPVNQVNAGTGMYAPGSFAFAPARDENRTKARCRFRIDASVGTWAMEMIHCVTDLTDFYNGVQGPGDFEEMDKSGATHPTAYTKDVLGWLDKTNGLRTHPRNSSETYTLHALGLPHPAPSSRVAGIKVDAEGSNRYLIIEARLGSDRWDRGFSGSTGIPSEGVVVYEFAPEEEMWDRNPNDPNGPWAPLELRTQTALTVGQSFTHTDSHVTGSGSRDNRSGFGRQRRLTVRAAVPGGFIVDLTSS